MHITTTYIFGVRVSHFKKLHNTSFVNFSASEIKMSLLEKRSCGVALRCIQDLSWSILHDLEAWLTYPTPYDALSLSTSCKWTPPASGHLGSVLRVSAVLCTALCLFRIFDFSLFFKNLFPQQMFFSWLGLYFDFARCFSEWLAFTISYYLQSWHYLEKRPCWQNFFPFNLFLFLLSPLLAQYIQAFWTSKIHVWAQFH